MARQPYSYKPRRRTRVVEATSTRRKRLREASRPTGRQCEECGASIDERRLNAKMCMECAYDPDIQRERNKRLAADREKAIQERIATARARYGQRR